MAAARSGKALLVDFNDALEQRDTFSLAGLREALERAPRGAHSAVHVLGIAHGNPSNGLFGGRIDNVQGGSTDRVNPLAVNIKLEMIGHDARNLLRVGGC